jgi:hypothetical protein
MLRLTGAKSRMNRRTVENNDPFFLKSVANLIRQIFGEGGGGGNLR